jgi:hypothetical protein
MVGVKADFVADDHGEKDAVQRDSCLVKGILAATIHG